MKIYSDITVKFIAGKFNRVIRKFIHEDSTVNPRSTVHGKDRNTVL